MSEVATLVQTTIRTSAPVAYQLPSIIWLPFKGVHFIHRIWSYWRRASLYSNPSNFAAIGAEHCGAGQVPFLRASAQAAMIAGRIAECIDEQMKLYRHCRMEVHTIKGHYLPRATIQWSKKPKTVFISPSTDLWFKIIAHDTVVRAKKLSYHTAMIITGMFQLSMLMIDTVESFSLSPETGNQSVREFSRNTAKTIDTLANNGEELLKTITTHKVIIQKILTGRNIPISVDSLIEILSKTVHKANVVNDATKQAQSVAGGLMMDLGKKGVFGLLVSAGMAELVPNAIVTKLTPPWQTQPKQTERYPPIEWITRPSKLPATAKQEVNLNQPPVTVPPIKHPDYFPISEEGKKLFQNTIANSKVPEKAAAPTTESRSRTIEWLNNPEGML